MASDELETLFRRYASGGDVDALGQVFDRAAPALHRLARRLAEDRHGADDLVQETFLTALEAPESFQLARPLMPWLVGILVNRARTARRSRRRELEPDRLPQRSVQEPDVELLQEEHDKELEAAVRELPNNLRVVVEARLAGVDSGELALRLGATPGALRVRLHRGLERLRRLLPPGFASLCALLLLHSQGLARARVRVLNAGRLHPLAHGATTGVSSFGIGAILMLKKLTVGVGLLAVLFVSVLLKGAFFASNDAGLPSRTEHTAPLPPSTSAGGEPVRRAQVQSENSATRTPLEDAQGVNTTPAAAELVLSGRVVGESGEPLVGAQVSLSCYGEWSPGAATEALDADNRKVGWVLKTDGRGSFRFEVPAPVQDRTRLTITPDDYHESFERSFGPGESLHLEAGVFDLGEIGLAEAGVVAGRLVAESGAPIAGGRLYLSNGGTYTLGHDTWTESDGSWRMPHAPIGERGVVARAEGFISRFSGGIEIERGQTSAGIEIELSAAGELRGSVVDSNGKPLAGVQLSAMPTEYHETGSTMTGSGETDAEGSFCIFVDDPWAYMLKAELEGYLTYSSAREERRFEPGETNIRLVLEPLTPVDFYVVDRSNAEPVTVFSMAVDFDRGSAVAAGPPRGEVSLSRPSEHAQGHFQHGAREGADLVRIEAPGYRDARLDVAFDDMDQARALRPRMTIRLQPSPQITGRVLRGGESVEGALVRLLPGSRSSNPRDESQPTDTPFSLARGSVLTALTDAEGRFRILDSEWRFYSLRCVTGDGLGLQRDFVPGAYRQAVDVGDLELEPLASLHGHVTLPAGIRPGGLALILDGDDARLSAMVKDSGNWELRDIPAGMHTLFSEGLQGRLDRGDGVQVSLAPGQDKRLDLDLTELLLAQVALTLTSNGVPLVGFSVHLHPLDPTLPDTTSHSRQRSSFGDRLTDADGHIEAALRALGSCWVEIRAAGGQILSSREELLITPGGKVERSLDIKSSTLNVRLPRNLQLPANARLTLELRPTGPLKPLRPGERSGSLWIWRNFSAADARDSGGMLTIPTLPLGDFELSWRLTDRDAPKVRQDLGDGTFRSESMPLATGTAKIVFGAEPISLDL